MGLFKSDLYRSFAAGFLAGAVGLVISLGGSGRAELFNTLATSLA